VTNLDFSSGIPSSIQSRVMTPSTPSFDSVPAVDASTVIVVRDGTDGIEVLMLERHIDSDFVGGAYVFPGGKTDASDLLHPSLWSGIDPEVESVRMEVTPETALRLYVAAVRETFEEGGLLFAGRAGEPIDGARVASPSFVEARRKLNERESRWDWSEWLVDEGLILDLGAVTWWSWWVTPKGVHRRFDTRFFIARAPQGQEAAHDQIETVQSVWATPTGALAAAAEGRATVIFPTRKTLEMLGRFGAADEAIDWAGRQTPPRIEPEIVKEGERVVVRHELFGSTDEM
jgi:8-oxo-dGTP pyrophosphatase MutT (NUDIX family)